MNTKNQVITNIAIVYAPIRYKRIKDIGVIIEGKKILNWTFRVEWNKALTCCVNVPYALTWFFITFSTPVASGWLCQTSSLDIFAFLRVANWIPWLEWGSHPTAAQWGSDQLFLSSTHRLYRDVVFFFCNAASSSLDQCIKGQLPWPWQHTQRGLWNDENQKVLWNRLNKHLLGALEVTLILSWPGWSLKTHCHTDNALKCHSCSTFWNSLILG